MAIFGFCVSPSKIQLDPYDVFWNHLDKVVKITFKNKLIKSGIIVKEILNSKENRITAWKFVQNKNFIKYQSDANDNLIEIILHSDIQSIENL